MFFLDANSWIIHSELSKEIQKLELQKKAVQKLIKKDTKEVKLLQNNDSLERFAREYYKHKRENETIFIIEFEDSIK
jgi:cell division protein DivIC